MGTADRDKLVLDNLHLARYFARRLWAVPLVRRLGEFEDAVQCACVALLRAATYYDPAKGRFSTYAGRVIRHHLLREAAAAGPIRVPSYAVEGRALDGDHYRATQHALFPAPLPAAFDRGAADARAGADVGQALAALPPAWRAVLVRHFGLDGRPRQPLAAVGRDLGITKQRAWQLESQGLRRLREQMGVDGCP